MNEDEEQLPVARETDKVRSCAPPRIVSRESLHKNMTNYEISLKLSD